MFFPLEDFASQLSQFSDVLDNDDYEDDYADEVTCPKCKCRLSDFLRNGFVGCSTCYKVFKNYAREMALNYHGRLNHVGKVPKLDAKALKSYELDRLLNEKEEAVKAENYIRANELKMQIKKLREELK